MDLIIDKTEEIIQEKFPQARKRLSEKKIGNVHHRHPKEELVTIVSCWFERNKIDQIRSKIKELISIDSMNERSAVRESSSKQFYELYKTDFPKDLLFFEWIVLDSSLPSNFELLKDQNFFSPHMYDVRYLIGGNHFDKKRNYGNVGKSKTNNKSLFSHFEKKSISLPF